MSKFSGIFSPCLLLDRDERCLSKLISGGPPRLLNGSKDDLIRPRMDTFNGQPMMLPPPLSNNTLSGGGVVASSRTLPRKMESHVDPNPHVDHSSSSSESPQSTSYTRLL